LGQGADQQQRNEAMPFPSGADQQQRLVSGKDFVVKIMFILYILTGQDFLTVDSA
jgi:hypothetical protein